MANHAQIDPLLLDGDHLTLEDIVTVARQYRSVESLAAGTAVYERVEQSRQWVQRAVEENARLAQAGKPARAYYGINTGFGIHAAGRPLSDPEHTRQASRKLIISHATGVSDPLDEEVVRAGMLIRANTLSKGRSGVRPVIINRLIEMLNRRIAPVVPSMGSLGASGDLAPLAHLALVLSQPPESMAGMDETPGFPPHSGEALIWDQNAKIPRVISASEAMTWEGVDQRVVLEAKEGLALNNGATFSAALGALALVDGESLIRHAELATALTLEALQGYRDAFLPQVHHARGHPGQIASAANILALAEGSHLLDLGHLDHDPVRQPPQDAYSVRCAPQVIGATREVAAHIRAMLEREINAVTDNPLIFADPADGLPRDYKAVSGGNFHGEPIAFGMDHLSIAVTELASISERRTFWLMNPKMARGLPSMLVAGDETHIDSGLMITQYVAASLVSRCKTLAHPDSVDSIPSSADQEDHVSMSMNAALHAREIVDHAAAVIAIELLAAITAIRHRLALLNLTAGDLGWGAEIIFRALPQIAPQILQLPLDRDVLIYPTLHRLIDVVKSGTLIAALREAGFVYQGVRSTVTVITED